MGKTHEQLKAEALKAIPKEMLLREDAYSASAKSNQTNEFVFPFISSAMMWIAPVEQKYAHLSPIEVSSFYLKDFADPFLYPNEYIFYYAILDITNSIEFDYIPRSGDEWAYSKAFIKRILTPDHWNGDLFRYHEIPHSKRKGLDKYWFNYFDYMKAWEGVHSALFQTKRTSTSISEQQ